MIKLLDCTLRDGGYVNNWYFHYNNIKKIEDALEKSNIDIIECGFIEDSKYTYDSNYAKYNSFSQINKKRNKDYALMLLTEKYNIEDLPKSKGKNEIIRLSFHKSDVKKAIKYSKIIKSKGYRLFWQPTATMRYTNDELDELFKVCNEEIMPESIALVDTFGEMKKDDVIRLSKLFNKKVNKNITISFHAHNNLQNAFYNALEFLNIMIKNNRNVVIDSSIFGMGRGAGNLCSELIIEFLNNNYDKNYYLDPLLDVTDTILTDIRKENYWGYSLEFYLSAKNSCHPNYSIYLSNKKSLTTSDINNILNMISFDKKIDFDKDYAEGLYQSYNEKEIDDEKNYQILARNIKNKKVILIGPGRSILENKNKITKYLNKKDDFYSISINQKSIYDTDAIFISNRKRKEEMEIFKNSKYIFTSNVESKNNKHLVFDYQKNIASELQKSDNSLLMMLNILRKIGVKEIYLAGFDGYELNNSDNFYDNSLSFIIDKNKAKELNESLKKYIKLYKKELNITFITKSKYEVK